MARVIQGIPASWDPNIANIRFQSEISTVTWSPCSKLIAASNLRSSEIAILDAVTLKQLHTMHVLKVKVRWTHITFSPSSHLLTAHSSVQNCIINWDLQTGGLLSNISTGEDTRCTSMSYSECETMIGGLFDNGNIIIYNVLSGICIFSHSIQQSIAGSIWTCGERLQFATVEPGSITKWQLSFTLGHPPTKVDSLSTPDNFSVKGLLFLPTFSQLAFIHNRRVLVWDAQNQKVLLDSEDINDPRTIYFSSDGNFLVCETNGREFHVWKKSPTGYLHHQTLVSGAKKSTQLISPNGESVISFSHRILQLWHTTSSPTSPISVTMQAPPCRGWFFIEFSSDQSLVAVTEQLGSTVTVLDTKSGNPWLVIDTDTRCCGLRMTGDKIIVIGDGKIVTWDLPARDHVISTRKNLDNSVHITTFKHSAPIEDLRASVSPNLKSVAFGDKRKGTLEDLCIYSLHTGEKLVVAQSDGTTPGFILSGHEVWCARSDEKIDHWEIVEENGSNTIKLERIEKHMKPPGDFSWLSPYGYQVTNDGWILGPSGKWLLRLPRHGQPDIEMQRKWSGKFLAVWNRNTLEPCILELEA